MSDFDWREIERRAELWLRYGDRTAFTDTDLLAVLGEVRQLRAIHRRLAALNQQYLTRLADPAGLGRLAGLPHESPRPVIHPTAIIPPPGGQS